MGNTLVKPPVSSTNIVGVAGQATHSMGLKTVCAAVTRMPIRTRSTNGKEGLHQNRRFTDQNYR
jgi:hypothetical protein